MSRKRESLAYPGKSFRHFPSLCLLVMLVLPFTLASRQVELRFRCFGMEEGLSTEFINDLFFDRQGILWIATDLGLNCFDGYSFHQYKHQPGDPNSLSGNKIIVLHDDHSGRMWVRTEAGLDILDPRTGQAMHLGPTEVNWGTSVCAMEETRNGEMWLGTMQGRIHLLESSSGRSLPLPEALRFDIGSGYPVAQILEDERGDIWMCCWKGGLLRYTPASGRLSRFPVHASLVCPDEKELIWYVDSTNLGCLDLKRGTSRLFPLPNQPYTAVDCVFLQKDPNGLLWFGSNLGLALFDSKSGKYIDSIQYRGEPRSVIPKYIAGLSLDAAGNIWMGTFGTGICRFNPRVNQFRFIGKAVDVESGLSYPWVNCLLEDRVGIVWIGTRYGGLSKFDPATSVLNHMEGLQTFSSPGSDFAKSVFSLCEAGSGSLWVGAASGLFLIDRKSRKFNRFALPPVLHPSYKFTQKLTNIMPRVITSILEEETNILWISTSDEGVYRIDNKAHATTHFKMDEILTPDFFPRRLNSLFLDRSRSLWVCTDRGIHRFERANGRFSHFLTGIRTFCAHEDRSGNFWIGSDLGLNLMDRRHETFKRFAEKEGLAGGSIYCLAEDDDGFVWGGTSSGLSRFDPKRETFRNFDANDGVAIGGADCIIRCRDGQLLAGGYKGIVLFDPREVVKTNTHMPPMYFSALRVGDREVPLHQVFSQRDQAKETGRVTMRPGEPMLSVEFAALDFSAPEKNQYAFRIEEQGGEWNDLGTRRQITFSNLGVGEHTLRIKGSNNDGVWNEKGVALRIEVLPALWQTWWFKLLALFLLAGAALLIFAVCRTIASLKKIVAPPNLDEIFNKHKISHREQEILHLVIQGKSNREMEQMLYISLPTVKRHLANIYEKIGVSSRLQLINFLQGRKPRY